MAQTSEGALKARETNKAKYGEDYYSNIGTLGGSVKTKKGFACMPKDKISAAGRKGGTISRRGK